MKKAYHCERGEHSLCAGCRCYCHLFDKGTTSLSIALKRLWRGARSTWPLVSRETMNEALAAKDKERELSLRDLRERHKRELDAERQQIESLMPKLIEVNAEYRGGRAFGRFHIGTEITDDFVYQVLSTGDRSAIDYMGERMAREMVRQIRTIDFARVRASADFDDMRRRSMR